MPGGLAAVYTTARFGLAASLTADVHWVTGRDLRDVEATAHHHEQAT